MKRLFSLAVSTLLLLSLIIAVIPSHPVMAEPAYTEQTGGANPFNGVDVGDDSTPAFVDIDGDGDMDAFIGEIDGVINYYRNTGTALAPAFTEQTGGSNPFDGVDVGYSSAPTFVDIDGDGDMAPAFADIDGDGDMDAFIGEEDGYINYYRNTGTALAPAFTEQTGGSNPFDGVDVGVYSTPTFVDIDGDGDMDAFIGELDGIINYYRNTGTALAPAFTEQTGVNNPFNGVDLGDVSTPAFTDIDGDGDMDAFIGEQGGIIKYYRNTGDNTLAPTFTAQTGGANPFDGVNVGRYSVPAFVDIDGDGDMDAFIGESEGNIKYYLNTGTALAPTFTVQIGGANPFDGVDVGRYSVPAFVDIDGDGDMDAFIGQSWGTIKYYLNTGTALAPAFTEQTGGANPLNGVDVGDVGGFSAPAFADIDGDGDMDAFIGEQFGNINYYLNTAAPEIDVSGNSVSIVDGDTTPSTTDHTDFDSADISTGTVARTFTITNSGSASLNLTGASPHVSISGTHAADFSVTAIPSTPVASGGGTTTFTITFDPSAAGERTATLSIANDDADENPYDFSIQGTGVAPEINLKEGVTDIADGGSYDFGSQLLSTDTDVTFTIENTGTADLNLTILPITVGGADAGQFSIQTQPTSPVAASGSTTFTVRFTPTSVGAKTATISIANNDDDENPYDLTITGTGFIPEEPEYHLQMNLLGTRQRVTTSSSGRLDRTLEVTSADGSLIMTIPRGTKARQENGNRLTTLSVSENDNPPPPPENKNIIGLSYSFEPNGATFDPPITLTFTYDPGDIPEGAAEEDLVLAFYDEDTGEWMECECTCDPENNCITACVCHFTDFAIIAPVLPPPPPVPAPAAFSLSDLSVLPAEVELGETITVSMVIANTGGEAGSYTAVLKINGVEGEEKTVTIAAGSNQTVSFSVTREEAGSYTVAVGWLSGSFIVVVPPASAAFSLSGLSVLPAEVELDETITVSMVVANTGGEAGSYTAVLKINGVKEEEKTVTIAAGSSQTVSFSVTKEEAGSYTVVVGWLSGSFTVVAPPAPTAESTPAVDGGGINWYIIGSILGVVLLLSIVLPIWIRRRREG